MNEYEVRVTRQALEQMKEIVQVTAVIYSRREQIRQLSNMDMG